MNSAPRSRVVLLLSLLCATSVTGLFWQQHRIRDLERHLADARAREIERASSLASAGAAGSAFVAPETDGQSPEAEPQSEPTLAPPRPEPAPGWRRAAGATREILENPAVQKAFLAQLRAGLDQRFSSLFRRLDLSPAELQSFKDLLVERQAIAADVRLAGGRGGVSDPAELQALIAGALAASDVEIEALLGSERFAQFEDFQQFEAQQTVVDRLERRLGYTSSPLSPEQRDQLFSLLVALRPADEPPLAEAAAPLVMRTMPGAGLTLAAGSSGMPAITETLVEQAAGMLTHEQLAALLELQAEQQAVGEMFSALREAGAHTRGIAIPAEPAPLPFPVP